MRFRLLPGNVIQDAADCALLFSESEQQIQRLNPTSALLCRRLVAGATIADLESDLMALGVSMAAQRDWAVACLAELSQLNLLRIDDANLPEPLEVRSVCVSGITVRLRFYDRKLFERIWPPFRSLAVETDRARSTYDLWTVGPRLAIRHDSGRAVLVERAFAAIRLKGMILDELLHDEGHLVALHAACVSKGESTLLLLGSPGAGKTTLLLRLLANGYGYVSDDVTLVGEEGDVTGVPFPLALKQGSWDLGLSANDGPRGLPSHLRPDGIAVRLLPIMPDGSRETRRVSTIIRLRRSSGQRVCISALPPSEALASLLSEARSPSGRCSVATFRAIGKLIQDASCFELAYDESAAAISVLDEQLKCPSGNPQSANY